MMYDSAEIERLRNALSIEEVIGRRIPIKKKSSYAYVGLCPFHNDSHPSMQIHTGKQIFKCFACGAGGDAFKFVSDFEHLSFPEAIELLAKEAGFQLKPKQGGVNEKKEGDKELNQKIKASNEYALEVYHKYLLLHHGAKEARRYLLSRKISAEMAKRYQIGYAPDDFHFLDHLLRNRYPKEILEKTGLFSVNKQGETFDFFRGRLMFPIINERNEVLGFGGRILSEDKDQAKYMNTRETPIFFKSNVLYGLNYSRTLIYETKKVFVVEGYLDVIACLEAGLGAVAPLGTSLTESHLRKLKRFDSSVYFLFDGDGAGQKAALKACKMSLSLGIMAFVAMFDEKMDPFDVFTKKGLDYLKNFIENNKKTSVEYLLEVYGSLWRQKNEHEKASAIRELSAVLAAMGDEILKEQVLASFSKKLNIEPHLLIQRSSGSTFYKTPQTRSKTALNFDPPINNVKRMQRRLVIFLISYPNFIKDAMSLFSPEDFEEDVSRALYDKLIVEVSKNDFNLHSFLEKLDDKTRNYVEKQIFNMEEIISKGENKERFFHGFISKLKEEGIKRKIRLFKEKMAETQDESLSKTYREELMRLLAERNNLIRFFSKNKS